MGSPFAPSFANTYMQYFEENYIYMNNMFTSHFALWKCYIDNVFLLWHGHVNELQEFFVYLNNCSEYLTFTMDLNSTRISFVDAWIISEKNIRHTDLFIKPTVSEKQILVSEKLKSIINRHITCNSKSVIYLITCPCGKSYVGKTSREHCRTPQHYLVQEHQRDTLSHR